MAIQVFPTFPGLAFPVKRMPTWSTGSAETLNGRRMRWPYWSSPRWTYEVNIAVLRQSGALNEYSQMIGFFNSCSGDAVPFLYDETTDDTVTTQQFGTGDGTTTVFQLLRAFGGFAEPVYAPDAGFTIFINGTPAVLTTDYTVDSYGRITFVVAPAAAAVLTWTGTFKWYCLFDDPQLQIYSIVNNKYAIDSLKFSTEKY